MTLRARNNWEGRCPQRPPAAYESERINVILERAKFPYIVVNHSFPPAAKLSLQPYKTHTLGGMGSAILGPLYMVDIQRSQKAKTTFETRRTTFEVVLLMSYVSNTACGTVF